MPKEEEEVILSPKSTSYLEGLAVKVSVQENSVVIRIPFIPNYARRSSLYKYLLEDKI